MELPTIDPESITNLEEAKTTLRVVLNRFEDCLHVMGNQQETIQRLQEENARLKGQPKKPHFTPPQDKQGVLARNLLRDKTSWHKKGKGKLPIDHHENLAEVGKCECGSNTFRTIRTHTKAVQGIVFQRNNVAYHGKTKQCVSCGKTYKSILPNELKGVSFDPLIASFVSYLKFSCRMTYPLILRMLKGFGIQISNGEINELILKNGDKLQPAVKHLKTVGFQKSSHLQSDATGSKRKDKNTGTIRNQYAQVISNRFLSVFSITKYYNIKTLNMLLGKVGRSKPFVGDDGSPNNGCACTSKQVCWVHEIRHYKKLFPFFNPHQRLAEQILSEWGIFYHLAKQYGSDPPTTATSEARAAIEELFDKVTSQVTEYNDLNRKLKLTRRKKDRLLLFLDHPYLPIHNNQCEQDLRQFVIIRKISGETKSARGDRSIARHLSIIQTAQKQGLDIFATLHGLLTSQLSPAVLTANIS